MSVAGEFRRHVNGCVEFLEGSEAADAMPWADRLHAARAIAAGDLCAGAQRVVDLEAGPKGIADLEFEVLSEREEFRERCDTMLALAKVIVGAPAG